MTDDEEQWAVVEGFEDYAVSSHGRVKNIRLNHILSPRPNSYGRTRVSLRKEGKNYEFTVARLVAAAFLDSFLPRYRIKLVEGNSDHVKNIRFYGDHRLGRPIKNIPQVKYRHLRVVETGMVFRTVEDCANYLKTDKTVIYRVLRGERPHHRGLTFEFFEG